MKKIIFTSFVVFIFATIVNAQTVASYTFAQGTGTLTALTATYTQHTSGTTDFGTYSDIPIGFTFVFNAVSYTTVSISNDGFIVFGNSISNSYTPLSSGTSNNVISALSADLQGLSTGSIRSKMTGTSPNRIFTIEWLHYEKYSGTDNYSFWIVLNETTNVINIYYIATTIISGNTFEVGLRGASSADFNNRTKATNTAWTSSSAGALNTNTMITGNTTARSPNGKFTWTPPVWPPMTYTSSTTTQTVTSSVGVNTTSNQIIGLEVVTSGSTSPLSATSFTFNTTGTTAPATDITNAKLWSTGTSSTFATTTQVGTVITAPNGTFTITGSQTLSSGTNYFWLTYDVPSGATLGNVIDAQCTSLTVGTAKTPTVTNPTGSRPIALNYCTPAPTSVDGTGITNVTMGTINNTTGAEAGNYGDYSAQTTNVTQGVSQTVNITFSTGYTYYCKIWVDWNNDGDFDDAGEEVYSGESLSTNPTTLVASFTVPVTASLGSHRLRIGGTDSSTPIPCYTGSYGSYEDYSVNVIAPSACSGTPIAGTATASPNPICLGETSTLTLSGYSNSSGLIFQWQSGPSSTGPWSNISGATSYTYDVTPSASTYYQCIVTCTNSGLSATSSNVQIIVNSLMSSCYCTSSATLTSDMDITNITLGTINNTTPTVSLVGTQGTAIGTAGMYSDFWGSTVPIPTLVQGSTNAFSVTIGGTAYGHAVYVFIDFNQNGDLTDAGEKFTIFPYANPTLPNTTNSSITIPITALTGNTLMRVLCVESSTFSDPCGTYTWGETEDYTINITTSTPMLYSSCTTTQPNTSDVHRNSTNQEVVCLQVVTTGYSSPLSATSFTFNTTGTTAPAIDITNAKLWTTGSGGTFATTTQVGSLIASPNGTFSFTGSVTLANGTNYFWLTYDVPAGATINNYIDAQCTSVTISSVAHSPSVTNPAGNRKIIDALTWDGTFESATDLTGNGFTSANGTPNYWIVGTAINNGGTRCAYITNDGSSNAYTITTTTYSHFYFDYTFPAGQSIINLNFDWHCEGEGTTYDYDNLKVFIQPTSVNPVSGTANGSTYLVGDTWYNFSSGWLSENITLNSDNAGTTKRIVFQWKNDASSGTQPPIAIDNIVINTSIPTIPPGCATNLFPLNSSTDLCLNSVLTWDSPTTGQAASGYYLSLGTDNPPTNIENNLDLATSQSYYLAGLNPNTTYYWEITPYNTVGPASSCTIYSFTTSNSDLPANDLPCNAENIPLGSTASGNNECSNDYSEPTSVPTCWSTGVKNTVWYSFQAPALGAVEISTIMGTIGGTQIAVYSGTCNNLVYVNCNQDASNCGESEYNNSYLSLSSLTSGDTYFVVVDGENDDVGTFNITISDATIGLPVVYGQDCGIDNAIPVCNNHFAVGDPGFQAIGNHCDFDGTNINDCTSGERGAVWYHIQIGANGILDFTLVPNDYDGSVGSETDYDFLLYKMVGTGAVTCEQIANESVGPIRCNYSSLGVTGLYSTVDGTAPPAYPSYNDAFEPELNVLAGEEYFLVIQNYSNSTSGFDLNLGTSPITVPGGIPTSLTWTGGGNSTNWYDPLNWGDCAYYPIENIDANIIASSTYQPVINALDPNNGNNARAKSLSISGGSNLTINTGQTIEIYGDYNNSGILNAQLGSNTKFTGTATQNLDGSLQGASAFDNCIITKTAGSVITNQDIEITGNYTSTSNTSIFNLNDKTFTIGGNFTNFNAGTTFTGATNSTFIFNGDIAQTYSPGGTLNLHNVFVENSIGDITLLNNLNINSTGSITFTDGIVNTGIYSVIVNNTANTAINTGNTNSYVNGTLQAYVANNTQLYNLPIGDADQYTLARIQNHNLAGVSYLTAKFYSTFTSTGSLDPTRALDYATPYLSLSSGGMWEIIPNVQPSSGNYDILLTFDDGAGYDGSGLSLGNAFTGLLDNQFGVLKRNHTSDLAADWYGESIGTINANNGIGRLLSDGFASRYGITSFSDYSIGISSSLLPIELKYFTSDCKNNETIIYWATASETNNNYFEIERSYDLINFESLINISGAGNSNETKSYFFIDKNASKDLKYYRLSQTDYDGTKKYYNTIVNNCKSMVNNSIFANQYGENSISLNTNLENGDYFVKIINNIGQIIFESKITVSYKNETFTFTDNSFTKGLYILNLENEKINLFNKLILK